MMQQDNFVIWPGFPGSDMFKLQRVAYVAENNTLVQDVHGIPLNFSIQLFTSQTAF